MVGMEWTERKEVRVSGVVVGLRGRGGTYLNLRRRLLVPIPIPNPEFQATTIRTSTISSSALQSK